MNLAKGTRVRMTKPLQEGDKVGEIYTVERSNESVVVLTRSREYEVDDFMGSGFGVGICGYGVTPQEFSEYFEVIGMEEPKQQSDGKVINLGFTEEELDALWAKSASFEHFKKKLKSAAKEKDKPTKGKRQWTPWATHPLTGFAYSVSHPAGKSAKVKVNSCGFVGIASCNPEDVWDLDVGIELAAARAEVKRTKAEVLKKKDLFRESLKNRAEAVNSLDAITGRIYRKAAK